jgi:hypothetical protein
MRALLLLVPMGLALAGCTSYRVAYVDPPVYTVSTPAVVATGPIYSTPSYDMDGDGTPNAFDRFPADARYR